MIKTEEIKRLLDRYYDGMTTEEEEKALHTYFNGSDIDASLTVNAASSRLFSHQNALHQQGWKSDSVDRLASGTPWKSLIVVR